MADMSRPHTFIGIALLLTGFTFRGCQPKAYDDPLTTMQDQTISPSQRLAAAEQAEAELGTDEKHLLLLERLVWERGNPKPVRLHAIDALVRLDAARAHDHFRYAIVLMNDWQALGRVLDIIVEREWADLTPAIVRNYSRPAWSMTDDRRPEREALAALHPGKDVEQIAFEVFDGQIEAEVRERAAAWQLLCRLVEDREALLAMLSKATPDTALVADLQAGGRDLHIVADRMQTIAWLQMLRTEPYGDFWQAAKRAVASLDADQRHDLALRHLPTIVWMHARNDPAMRTSRSDLLRQLTDRLARADHHLKSTTHDGQSPDHPQLIHEWREQLAWGDLAVMREIMRAMQDRSVVAAWFSQAEADHADESSEHGGLLAWQADGSPVARPYAPMMRNHDLKYVSPKQLILDGYTGLAHYHFHAQSMDNTRYAGPGRGDLERIGDLQRLNGLVLTPVGAGMMNVDFYRSDDVVVDLGTIHR